MSLKNAPSIDDVAYEDVIDFRELATWLRDFADPDLYEPEDYPSDDARQAVSDIILMLGEMGCHQTTNGPVWTWDVVADQLQELGDDYGAALIRGTYWLDYVKDYAEEMSSGGTERPPAWPYNHIDWQAAADELGQDYSEVTLAGVNFFIRDF